MEKESKKRKGGAEKLREQKRKALAAQAAKSLTVTQMFAAGAGLAGASSTEAGPCPSRESDSDREAEESEAPITALMVQEEAERNVEKEETPCEGGSRFVIGDRPSTSSPVEMISPETPGSPVSPPIDYFIHSEILSDLQYLAASLPMS